MSGSLSTRISIVLRFSFSVSPHLYDPEEFLLYISPEELVDNLKITLTGCSSSIHIWNKTTETFEVQQSANFKRTLIIMEGMDEVVTARYHSLFVVTVCY